MNELGIAIVWLALQVSLLCLVAAALYAIVRNGSPRTRGILTQSALWLVVPLSVVAFCPWPSWLDQAADVEVAAEVADSNSMTADSGSDSATKSDGRLANRPGGIGLLAKAESLVRAIGDEMRANQGAAAQSTTLGWAGWLAIGFLSALAIGLLRMFVGIVAVKRYGRRASPVADKSLQETLDVLMAEVSCDRAIQLRE